MVMNEWGPFFVPETRNQVRERVLRALIEVEANKIGEEYTFAEVEQHVTEIHLDILGGNT